MANETNIKTNSMDYQNKTDASKAHEEDPRAQDQAKAIAIPLFVLVLLCIVVFILKLKYSKSKIGTVASRYQISSLMEPCENPLNIRFKSLIGRGSFGVVWKASLNDVIVAVKMCSSEQKDRWEKEKSILSSIDNHPNIVKLIESEVRRLRDEIALVIVLEFVDNGDLRTYLMKNILNVDKALFLLKSLFDGLRFLHSRKDKTNKTKNSIVHRDIKSSNILVSSAKGCVIADFGLAFTIDEDTLLLPEDAKAKVGTSRYMAPEKLKGVIDTGNIWQSLCLIDIYAASIVTYEVMTRCYFEFDFGKGYYAATAYTLPFSEKVGAQPTNDDMKGIVVYDNIRPTIPEVWNNNTVVKQIKDLILRCWDKNPNQRKSAEQMFEEIRMIFVNHELEPNYHSMDDVLKYTENDNLLIDNNAITQINRDYKRISESFGSRCKSTCV